MNIKHLNETDDIRTSLTSLKVEKNHRNTSDDEAYK